LILVKRLSALELDDMALRLEALAAEEERLRSELREQIDQFGFSPPRSEKSKRLVGAAFTFTLSTSSTTELRDAEIEQLRKVCQPSIFRKLFVVVTKFKLADGATALLAGKLPETAPRNLRVLFSRAVQVKEGSMRLRIEKLAAAAEATT